MMRRFTILKKAIKKAHDNGYHFPFTDYTLQREELFFGHTWWVAVIFSHDFAEAFWNWNVCSNCGAKMGECDCEMVIIKGSHYHLQQMVLEEDPIKYLAKYL